MNLSTLALIIVRVVAALTIRPALLTIYSTYKQSPNQYNNHYDGNTKITWMHEMQTSIPQFTELLFY